MNTAAIKKENEPAVKRRFPSRKRVLSIFFSEIFFVLSFLQAAHEINPRFGIKGSLFHSLFLK